MKTNTMKIKKYVLAITTLSAVAFSSSCTTTNNQTKGPQPIYSNTDKTGGGLTAAEINDTIKAKINSFRNCFAEILKIDNNENVSASHHIQFVIGPEGEVESSKSSKFSLSTNAKPGNMEQCALDTMSSLKFPKPRSGKKVYVNYPLNFAVRK